MNSCCRPQGDHAVRLAFAERNTYGDALSSTPFVQGPPVDVEARRPFIDRMLASRSRPPALGSAASMGPSKQASNTRAHLQSDLPCPAIPRICTRLSVVTCSVVSCACSRGSHPARIACVVNSAEFVCVVCSEGDGAHSAAVPAAVRPRLAGLRHRPVLCGRSRRCPRLLQGVPSMT